jgi:hypothetical protein
LSRPGPGKPGERALPSITGMGAKNAKTPIGPNRLFGPMEGNACRTKKARAPRRWRAVLTRFDKLQPLGPRPRWSQTSQIVFPRASCYESGRRRRHCRWGGDTDTTTDGHAKGAT